MRSSTQSSSMSSTSSEPSSPISPRSSKRGSFSIFRLGSKSTRTLSRQVPSPVNTATTNMITQDMVMSPMSMSPSFSGFEAELLEDDNMGWGKPSKAKRLTRY